MKQFLRWLYEQHDKNIIMLLKYIPKAKVDKTHPTTKFYLKHVLVEQKNLMNEEKYYSAYKKALNAGYIIDDNVNVGRTDKGIALIQKYDDFESFNLSKMIGVIIQEKYAAYLSLLSIIISVAAFIKSFFWH